MLKKNRSRRITRCRARPYRAGCGRHPRLAKGAPFKREYEQLGWEKGRSADAAFAAWCDGRTGYSLVDAAMLQLNQTG
ncbi:deoxyribodipyrimidine photolyase [Paraburkholderia sp. WSM4175]